MRGLLGLAFLLAGPLSWAEWEFVRTVNPMDGAEREFFVLDGVSPLQEDAPKALMEVRIAGRKSKCARVRMAFEFEDVAQVGTREDGYVRPHEVGRGTPAAEELRLHAGSEARVQHLWIQAAVARARGDPERGSGHEPDHGRT